MAILSIARDGKIEKKLYMKMEERKNIKGSINDLLDHYQQSIKANNNQKEQESKLSQTNIYKNGPFQRDSCAFCLYIFYC
jgi:hypothetical protein